MGGGERRRRENRGVWGVGFRSVLGRRKAVGGWKGGAEGVAPVVVMLDGGGAVLVAAVGEETE